MTNDTARYRVPDIQLGFDFHDRYECDECWLFDDDGLSVDAIMARPSKPGIAPFEDFPVHHQQRIARLVAAPKKPPYWLDLGLAQIPSRAFHEWYWQRGIDTDKRRAAIPRWMRERVYGRDGYACLACGTTENLSLDHIEHWSLGGADTIDNLRTLCRSCNSSRHTKTDEEWGRI